MSSRATTRTITQISPSRPSNARTSKVRPRHNAGKFLELLENEIKVLKTCDNKNIIKLYDIKKTANNFYLIL